MVMKSFTVKSDPYRKFIRKEKIIEESKYLEKENLEEKSKEEILRIAFNFCREVEAWDRADSMTSKPKLLSAHKKAVAVSTNLETPIPGDGKNFYSAHLSDPAWVAELFSVNFNTLYKHCIMGELKEKVKKDPVYDLLRVYETNMLKKEKLIEKKINFFPVEK